MDAAALRWFWERTWARTAAAATRCDEGRGRGLRTVGVPVSERHCPGMFHGFFAFPGLLTDVADALSGVAEAAARTAKDRKNSGDHGGSAG